ncbi:MAG: hypothetical protein ACP5NV_00845 [Candidatus Woesearchaeota archaeon]
MRFVENAALAVATILYVGTLMLLSLMTETSIFIVFIATMPILLFIISLFYLLKMEVDALILWALPIVFPLVFLIIWYTKTFTVLNSTDGPAVAVVNIMISYVINIFILLIIGVGKGADKLIEKTEHKHHEHHVHELKKELDSVKEQLHHTKKTLEDAHSKLDEAKEELKAAKELVVSKENFDITLRGIEDKCKAINFVIGRVYSDKRGASPETRDTLRIDPEWYNAFSEMTAEFQEEDKNKLIRILQNIRDKLLQLEKKEEDIIRIEIGKLPIYRKLGDTVLEVLARNDKDPIIEYHKEALEICDKTLKYLES